MNTFCQYKKATLILLFLLTPLVACANTHVCAEYVVAGNFAADLNGDVLEGDVKAGLWGTRAAWGFPLTFAPPPGHRVRILGVSGDLTARWTTRGNGRAYAEPGLFTGVLVAAAANYPSQGSSRADYAADDTFAYAQGDIDSTGAVVVKFRESTRGVQNNLLGPDHRLWFVVAKYLDETELATHLEVTFSQVRYRFEPVSGCE